MLRERGWLLTPSCGVHLPPAGRRSSLYRGWAAQTSLLAWRSSVASKELRNAL